MSSLFFISLLLLSLGVDNSQGKEISKRHAGRVKRLISGVESDHLEAPYMVSMQGKLVRSTFFGIPVSYSRAYCGGTVINERWVLTAAHCFRKSAKPNEWHARMSSPNIERTAREGLLHLLGKITDRVEWQQMEFHPEKIVLHPDYVDAAPERGNDIALVKLKETIPLSATDRVGTVELADPSDIPIPGNCTAYGWGCKGFGRGVTSKLQKATLPLVSDSECQRIWRVSPDTSVCAGGKAGNMQSACHGDSGGPLVCQTTKGKTKQFGVISFVSVANPTYYPVGLTRVSKYHDWIKNTVA